MRYEVQQVDWRDHGEALLAIRFQVFVEEQGVPADLEHDAADSGAIHVLATADDGTPIGTARMLDDGHIGRMAVLPEWRGRGVGSALLRALLRLAAARGQRSVFLHAQCSAEPFYARLGFAAEGDVFVDAGIDHRCMRRDLHAGND